MPPALCSLPSGSRWRSCGPATPTSGGTDMPPLAPRDSERLLAALGDEINGNAGYLADLSQEIATLSQRLEMLRHLHSIAEKAHKLYPAAGTEAEKRPF